VETPEDLVSTQQNNRDCSLSKSLMRVNGISLINLAPMLTTKRFSHGLGGERSLGLLGRLVSGRATSL
jgi:hypothetical protein